MKRRTLLAAIPGVGTVAAALARPASAAPDQAASASVKSGECLDDRFEWMYWEDVALKPPEVLNPRVPFFFGGDSNLCGPLTVNGLGVSFFASDMLSDMEQFFSTCSLLCSRLEPVWVNGRMLASDVLMRLAMTKGVTALRLDPGFDLCEGDKLVVELCSDGPFQPRHDFGFRVWFTITLPGVSVPPGWLLPPLSRCQGLGVRTPFGIRCFGYAPSPVAED